MPRTCLIEFTQSQHFVLVCTFSQDFALKRRTDNIRGPLIWGAAEEASISVTQEGLLASVIIWWLNGSTQSRAWRGNTSGTLMAMIGTEAHHWLQPRGGRRWHFHPIKHSLPSSKKTKVWDSSAWGEGGRKKTKRRNQFSHLLFRSAGEQSRRFYTNIRKRPTLTHTHS